MAASEPQELTGYNVLGPQLLIEAPDGTPADPLTIALTLDEGTLTAAGLTAATVSVLRNGAAIGPCTGIPGDADPDPCVSDRTTDGDGNAVITILTSHASLWGFGAADSTPPTLDSYGVDPGTLSESRTLTVSAHATGGAVAGEFYVDDDQGPGRNVPLGGDNGHLHVRALREPAPDRVAHGRHPRPRRCRQLDRCRRIPLTVVDMTVLTQPASHVIKGDPTFTFSTPETGATFQCSLDGGTYTACTSPKTYPNLAKGSHVFRVRATKDGSPDPTPSEWEFTNGPPPKVRMTAKAPKTTQGTATFSFASPDAGATFECSLDGSGFTPCTSPKTYTGLAAGSHTFSVHAVDAALRVGDALLVKWTVDLDPPETTISSGPKNPTTATNATFALKSDEKHVDVRVQPGLRRLGGLPEEAVVLGPRRRGHTFQARGDRPGRERRPIAGAATPGPSRPRGEGRGAETAPRPSAQLFQSPGVASSLWKSENELPSVSWQRANQPIPGIGCFSPAVPPASPIFASVASMSSVAM